LIFSFFRDEDLDLFARSLAVELNARVPPKSLGDRISNPKFEATLANAFHHVFLRVKNYRRDHALGLIKKARLSKVFQDELVGLGYSKDFVKEVTLALAEQLTQA